MMTHSTRSSSYAPLTTDMRGGDDAHYVTLQQQRWNQKLMWRLLDYDAACVCGKSNLRTVDNTLIMPCALCGSSQTQLEMLHVLQKPAIQLLSFSLLHAKTRPMEFGETEGCCWPWKEDTNIPCPPCGSSQNHLEMSHVLQKMVHFLS